MNERVFFTVSQVNLYIKSMLDKDRHMSDIIVQGEISNLKIHTSGHVYMSLKDAGGTLRAVMFRGYAGSLKFRPENGMKVIAHGRVSVYERDGSYQLYIDSMQPDGLGALHLAYEQLKQKLSDAGMFDEKKKKPIPKYPSTVGVITASTGAAVQDILNILSRRYPAANVKLYPVAVQGAGAAEQMCEAIRYFNAEKNADVLIIGRGGGSIEDLWEFNSEELCRAIYASEIPIISAVGHETDFTIADFAADVRAPTPSAAAELAVPSQTELRERLSSYYGRMLYAVNKSIEKKRTMFNNLKDKRIFKNPLIITEERKLYLDNLVKNIENAVNAYTAERKGHYAVCVSKLEALSPLKVIGRGYSVVIDKEGGTVKSVNDVDKGEGITVTVTDGKLECEVIGRIDCG